jgi:hypothetical protein
MSVQFEVGVRIISLMFLIALTSCTTWAPPDPSPWRWRKEGVTVGSSAGIRRNARRLPTGPTMPRLGTPPRGLPPRAGSPRIAFGRRATIRRRADFRARPIVERPPA